MEQTKRDYTTPELAVYGDVTQITHGLTSSGQPDLIVRANGRGHIVDGHKGHGGGGGGGGGGTGGTGGGGYFSH